MKIFLFLILMFFLHKPTLLYANLDNCDQNILEVKTNSIPDKFQAKAILNSFLRDQIIDDMTSWFTESHFPFGNSTAWHKINLITSTVDLSKHGFNEKLLMVYYQSQNYCGIGGQCSTFLLRNINNRWEKIDWWHEVKWEKVYTNSCSPGNIFIALDHGNSFSAPGPHNGRIINLFLRPL